ncbi:MAG TPA: hypothetical protein ENN60_02380 [archaeon]|nr:hypothetical protein [archaeon]
MNRIVCDASSIITLSSNCLLWLIEKFEIEFCIPPYVKKEAVEVPIKSRRHGLDAMRNGNFMTKCMKVLETDQGMRDNLLKLANSIFVSGKHNFSIIHYGEIDALTVAKKHGINTVMVDEKNTRLLLEDRPLLRKIMERRMGHKIQINSEAEAEFVKLVGDIKVVRSSELVAAAVKRDIFRWQYPKRELLRNALFALKFKGCAISEGEIVEIVNAVAPLGGSE